MKKLIMFFCPLFFWGSLYSQVKYCDSIGSKIYDDYYYVNNWEALDTMLLDININSTGLFASLIILDSNRMAICIQQDIYQAPVDLYIYSKENKISYKQTLFGVSNIIGLNCISPTKFLVTTKDSNYEYNILNRSIDCRTKNTTNKNDNSTIQKIDLERNTLQRDHSRIAIFDTICPDNILAKSYDEQLFYIKDSAYIFFSYNLIDYYNSDFYLVKKIRLLGRTDNVNKELPTFIYSKASYYRGYVYCLRPYLLNGKVAILEYKI